MLFKTTALNTDEKVLWFHSILDFTWVGFPSAGFSPLLLKYTNVQI